MFPTDPSTARVDPAYNDASCQAKNATAWCGGARGRGGHHHVVCLDEITTEMIVAEHELAAPGSALTSTRIRRATARTEPGQARAGVVESVALSRVTGSLSGTGGCGRMR